MNYVIGSGPTGVACAWMLLKKGLPVTMLDVGFQLENNRKDVVRAIRSRDPQEWDDEILKDYKSGFEVHAKGVKYKTSYGSLFPYKDAALYKSHYRDVSLHSSYARGGLSNVWGASIATYDGEDLQGWPISLTELKTYYDKVLSFMPISKASSVSMISGRLGAAQFRELKMSRQIQALNTRMVNLKTHPDHPAVSLGGSCLAVGHAHERRDPKECIYCGLCMYGCPFSLIYNSAVTLNALKAHQNFEYRGGIFVESLRESGGEVQIKIRDLTSGRNLLLRGDRVFIGAGVFSTARIMLSSCEEYDQPLVCQDSQYFLLPLLGLWGCRGVADEDLHTLAQLCLQVKQPGRKRAAFLQIYGYNDLYLQAIKSLTGYAYPVLKGVAHFFLDRLFLVQAFFHSDISHKIKIELKKNADGMDELYFEGLRTDAAKKALRDVMAKTHSYFRRLKVFTLDPLMDPGLPGRGYHSGGTFPMKTSPTHRETDLVGRPHGFRRVHLIDASVFPTIPAGPITFSAMANAARIADQHGQNP